MFRPMQDPHEDPCFNDLVFVAPLIVFEGANPDWVRDYLFEKHQFPISQITDQNHPELIRFASQPRIPEQEGKQVLGVIYTVLYTRTFNC